MRPLHSIMCAIAYTMLVSTYITFGYVFLTAYSAPSKMTVVAINQIGEANLELGLYITGLGFIIITFPMFLGVMFRNENIPIDNKVKRRT